MALLFLKEFIVGMFANKSADSNEYGASDNRFHDPNSIEADTDTSHPWYTHNQGYYDDD